MRSARPKPLHQICGRPMVIHVIHALADVEVHRTVVVVGHGAERVTKKVQEQAPGWAHVTFVEQTVQRGTGDATMVGMTAIPGDDLDDGSTIIVLPGDTPLLQRRDTATAGRHPSHQRQRGDRHHLGARRPDRLRASPAGSRQARRRSGAAGRRATRRQPRDVGHPRGVDQHVCVPARPAGSGSTKAQSRQRPGRVLPDRRRGGPGGHGSPDRHCASPRSRDPRGQRPLAVVAGRTRASQPHQSTLAAQRRDHARPAPDVHRRHRSARPAM